MIKRVMCRLCLSLILGILYGRNRDMRILLFLLVMAVIVAALEARCHRQRAGGSESEGMERRHPGRIICMAFVRGVLCTVIFGAGCVQMQERLAVRERLEGVLAEGDSVAVEGRISRIEEAKTSREKEAESSRGKEAKTFPEKEAKNFQEEQQFIYYLTDVRVDLEGSSYPCHGVLVYSAGGRYRPGNILNAVGRYAPFQISRNEGNFNEKQYRQSRSLDFRVYADSVVLCSRRENKYAVFLGNLRESMREVFVRSMAPEDAGVMADMALGEKSLIEPEVKALYRDAGISHVLAISGLHISILGMGLLSLLQKLGCRRSLSAVLAAAVVVSFGIFSGMEVSAVRAVSMFVLMMAAQVLGYTYDSLTALSLTAAVQLWGNPFLTEYAGFLFSYTAVLGVVVVWKIIRRAGNRREDGERERRESEKRRKESERGGRKTGGKESEKGGGKTGGKEKEESRSGILCRIRGKLWETICVSASIQIATLPLTLYFYYEIPSYGIFVNAVILPFMGALLFLGLFGGLIGCLFPGIGAAILMPAGWLLAFNEMVCGFSRKLPGANFVAGKPSPTLVFIYYAVLGICLYFMWRRRRRGFLAGIVLALFCILSVRPNPGFEIAVLDVGQGDGIFIHNENGEHFFIDGGSSDVKQVGQYRILPFLKSRGIRSIKGWIVSHADADHINGLLEALQMGYPVEYLVLAEHMVQDDAMETLVQTAEEAGCRILYVSPGMKFGSGNVSFTALAPEKSGTDRNASSLAVLLEHSGFRGIFTGDLGEEEEREMTETGYLARHMPENIDFYKAAHHGSDYSNSQEFLEALSPVITVISCAGKNSYGHPGGEALERIRGVKSRIFLTMEQGQICVRQEEEGIRVWTYLP